MNKTSCKYTCVPLLLHVPEGLGIGETRHKIDVLLSNLEGSGFCPQILEAEDFENGSAVLDRHNDLPACITHVCKPVEGAQTSLDSVVELHSIHFYHITDPMTSEVKYSHTYLAETRAQAEHAAKEYNLLVEGRHASCARAGDKDVVSVRELTSYRRISERLIADFDLWMKP